MICESSGFSDEWEKIVRVQHIKIIFSVSSGIKAKAKVYADKKSNAKEWDLSPGDKI